MPRPRLPHGEPAPSPEDASVTVTVARKVAVGREADFEQWVQGIVEAAARFPGFLGGGVLRPPHAGREWHVVYRFADAEKQRAWEESPERRGWPGPMSLPARPARPMSPALRPGSPSPGVRRRRLPSGRWRS
jgi:heme-degrading monooxygenase HmoA